MCFTTNLHPLWEKCTQPLSGINEESSGWPLATVMILRDLQQWWRFPSAFFLKHLQCLVAQSCLTLWNLVDCSPPGTFVHGDSLARILEWVAMPSSRRPSQPGIKPTSPPHCRRVLYCLNHQRSLKTSPRGCIKLTPCGVSRGSLNPKEKVPQMMQDGEHRNVQRRVLSP